MNVRKTHAIALRAASMLASICVTALIVSSQFGIASDYTERADARFAQSLPTVVTQPSASVPRRRL